MANDVTIAASVTAAQTAIGALNHALAPFKAFSTDFSSDASYAGDGVAVTVFKSNTATKSEGIKGDVDYAANANANTFVETVTIENSYYASSALKSAQNASMSPATRIEMKSAEIRAVIASFFADAEADLKSQAETFNLENSGVLTYADLTKLREEAVKAGFNTSMLSLILPPTLYASLASDETISKSYVQDTAADAIKRGIVSEVAGFTIYECAGLTDGFMVSKDSAAVACRYVPVDGLTVCEAVVHEPTGLVFTIKEFPNPNTDQVISVSHLYAGFKAISGGRTIVLA